MIHGRYESFASSEFLLWGWKSCSWVDVWMAKALYSYEDTT